MIGTHRHLPGIFDQQIPFQSDRPLKGVNEALFLIRDWHDAAAGLLLDISAEPFIFYLKFLL